METIHFFNLGNLVGQSTVNTNITLRLPMKLIKSILERRALGITDQNMELTTTSN